MFQYQKYRLLGFSGAALAAILVLIFAPAWLRGTVRAVAAYDAAALVLLLFDWTYALRNDVKHTQRRAAQSDPGRNLVMIVVLASVAAGLASAVVVLGQSMAAPPVNRTPSLALGIAAVALGWFLIHSNFIFRYAQLYYHDATREGDAQPCLLFPGTTEPDDYDFAYFSFVVGMTFQVSDVQISHPRMRSLTLFHAVLSFGYNTAILALGINLASSILNGH